MNAPRRHGSAGSAGRSGSLFQKAYHFFSFHREEFLASYHKRSNVESVFFRHQAKVWRCRLIKVRSRNAQRSAGKNPVPQHLLSDFGDVRTRRRTGVARSLMAFVATLGRPSKKTPQMTVFVCFCDSERFHNICKHKMFCRNGIRTNRLMTATMTPCISLEIPNNNFANVTRSMRYRG